jgi:hypothetical protein
VREKIKEEEEEREGERRISREALALIFSSSGIIVF